MSQVGVEPKATKATAVGKAGGIMVASMFLSRLLGLLRDSFIGGHFGVGTSASASWSIAATIPDIIFMLIAGGGLSSAFIPVFTEYWYTDRKKQAWRIFSVVVTICSLVALLLIVTTWLLAPTIIGFFWRDQPPAVQAGATMMSRILLPAQYAFLIGSILLGTLYARKQFLVPGLAPNVYNIGIIVGASVLPALLGFGIEGVAWGALTGAFIGNILLPLLVMIPQGIGFVPSLDVKTEGVSHFFKLLLPVIVGFSLPSVVQSITQVLADPYGPGSLFVIRCANNLMQAPSGIFGQSLALAAFPVLGQFYAEKKMDMYRSQLSKTLRTVLYLTIAAAVVMFGTAPLLVKVIYGYGAAAHEPGHLAMISNCLRIYSIAIPAWCVQPVLMRGFFSVHKTFKPIALSTGMTALFIGLCVLLQSAQFGVLKTGLVASMGLYVLPWATDFAAIVLVIVLYNALEGDVGKLDRLGFTRTIAKGLVSTIPMGLISYFGSEFVSGDGKLVSIGGLFLICSIAGWAYYYVTSWYKMPETAYLDKAFKKLRLKRT